MLSKINLIFNFLLLGVALIFAGCGKSKKGKEVASNFKPDEKAPSLQFNLPDDLEKIKKCGNIEIVSNDVLGCLSLRAQNVKEDFIFKVPMGTLAKNKTRDLLFVVCKDASMIVHKTGGAWDYYTIPVFLTKVDVWGKDRRYEQYNLIAPDKNSKIYKYLEKLNNLGKYDWFSAQIGLWVITDNIPIKKLYGLRIKVNSGFMGLSESVRRLHSYKMVKNTEKLLEKLGYKTGDYRMFEENRENFEKALASYKVDSWDKKPRHRGYSGNFFASLEEYKCEPAVKRLFVDYIKNHKMFFYRNEALRQLLDMGGLEGSDKEIYEMALSEKNRMMRFAAIKTLERRKDKRYEPLFLAYQYDYPLVGNLCNYRQKLEKDTGRKISNTEPILKVWAETGGWKTLGKEYGDIDALKKAVEDLEKSEEAFIDSQISFLRETENKNIGAVLADLARRFPDSKKMFDAVAKLALESPDEYVRIAALSNLNVFEQFNSFEILMDRIKNDKSAKVKRQALSAFSKITEEQRQKLLLEALKDKDYLIRWAAVEGIKTGRDGEFADELKRALIDAAKKDENFNVRKIALEKLCFAKCPEAGALIKEIIADSSKDNEKMALNCIDLASNMMKNAEMFNAVKKVALSNSNPKLRAKALGRLYMFGNEFNKEVLAVLIDRIKNDKNPKVRLAAVNNAGFLYGRRRRMPGLEEVFSVGMNSKYPDVRNCALGFARSKYVKSLESHVLKIALKDKDKKNYTYAAYTLKQWKSPKLFDVYAAWMKSKDAEKRFNAANSLTAYFGKEKRTVDLLAKYKNDKDPKVKRKIAECLKRMKK